MLCQHRCEHALDNVAKPEIRRFTNLINPVRAHCSLFLLLDLSARHLH
jgi:hypothetical protein